MPDHPSWPAELVEKAKVAAHELNRSSRELPTPDEFAQTVLSALSGDLVPREEHEHLELTTRDGWKLWATLTAADSVSSLVGYRHTRGLPGDLAEQVREVSTDCREEAVRLKEILDAKENHNA